MRGGLSCMHRMNEEQLDDELVPVVVRNSGRSPRLVQGHRNLQKSTGRESEGIYQNLRFSRNLRDYSWFCEILLDSEEFCQILRDSAGFWGILRDSARICGIMWVSLGIPQNPKPICIKRGLSVWCDLVKTLNTRQAPLWAHVITLLLPSYLLASLLMFLTICK